MLPYLFHTGARGKPFHEALHPETKQGGAPGAGRGKGKQKRKEENISSFQTETAEKIGQTARAMRTKTLWGHAGSPRQ